jgi:hypothetical protein
MSKQGAPVPIVEAYHDYAPPFTVRVTVKRLLSGVPREHLVGLARVVLTNAGGLARRRRRAKTWSRKRKVEIASCRGLYHEAWKGEGAWIELFVDRMLADKAGCALTLPFFRDSVVGETLFHELGHHIHKTQAPEHTEREDVADKWARRLQRRRLRRRYWYLIPLAVVLRLLIRLIPRRIRDRYDL